MPPTRILVVEDEMIIALGIEKQLEEMGYVVVGSAATGEDAIDMALELHPDLILMDIALGSGMDGVDAAELICRQIDVPVVYLTANSDPTTLMRAKLTGPFGYVIKPYEDKDLHTAIEIGRYRHKIELSLRENERWLSATLGSIGDGLIAVDEHGRVRFMNSLAEQMTGWTLADALKRDVREVFQIVNGKTRQPVTNPPLEALEKGEPVALAPDTMLIQRSGSEIPIDDSAAPIRDVNGKLAGAVLVFRDITERRRLEEQLRQSQKMEAIGRLAGGIAHNFNNITTVITGFSKILMGHPQLPHELKDFVKNIADAGARAAALTQQIMAFSRKQTLLPCVLDLNIVVRDMGGKVKNLIGESIKFETRLAPDLGKIMADPAQVGQAILDLATNARDAMRPGGRLVITTENTELGESTSRLHPDVKQGRYASLSISDTGIGVADEVIPHLFEPFFSTKEIKEGLGLATVYGFIKQSRGHIEVMTKAGEGTTFRIYLPLVEELGQQLGRETRGRADGNETILIVEDEEMVRQMMKKILQQSGYTILEAVNGVQAMAAAQKYEKPIHLLITDLVTPYLNGWELCRQLSALKPNMQVLFISSCTEDALEQAGGTVKANFLHKPFSFNALKNKVREILDPSFRN